MIKNIVILILILVSSLKSKQLLHKNVKYLTSGIINKFLIILLAIFISFENFIIGILLLILIFNLIIVDIHHNEKFRCKYLDDLEP